jgi:transposase InsO family protein
MLDDLKLKRLMDKHEVSATGRSLIERIRNGNPSRNVEGRAGNVACRYPSKKMGCTIQAESHKNELAAIYLWEHDDRTYEYYDQPPQLKMSYVKASGQRGAHITTPDFFVIQEDFIGWVECKTEEWLVEKEKDQSPLFVRDDSMTWQCPPAKEYASAFGLGFQLRSSAENPWLYIRNLTFLADYWNAAPPCGYSKALQELKSRLGIEKRLRLAELLSQPPCIDADFLFYAVANDEVYVDLFNELLSEQDSTYVYASYEISTVFNVCKSSDGAAASFPPVKALRLAPGATLTWAGAPFSVKTISGDHVYLQPTDGELMIMNREQLERLSKTGEIRTDEILVDTASVLSDFYRSASLDDLAEAAKRSKILDLIDVDDQNSGVSERTLRYWRQRQREAELKYNDPIIGLVPKISARGNRRRKLDGRVIEIMHEVISAEYAGADAKSVTVCWGHARNRCEAENLIPPSEKSFRREIKHSMSGYELTLAREGQRAAYSQEPVQFYLDRSSLRHGERPFEIAHIDHTQLDLQFVGSKFGEQLAKPWLSVMLDAYSRTVLAFVLMFDPPSYRTCMMLMRECLRRHSRVPSSIVVDRGAEFNGVYFEVFLARFGIIKKSRPPQKARFGSVMERFFGINNTQLVHNLRGNNKALQRPRQMADTHDPRKRAVWTLGEFLPKFEDYVFRIYGELEHPALGVSPNRAFAVGMARTGLRPMRLIPITDEIEMLCLPSTKTGVATVIPGQGLKIGYLYYRHALMRNPANARIKVPVRYDPFNLAIAYAYIEGQWRLCESEHSGLFEGKTEREIMILASEINGKNRRTGERRTTNAQQIAKFLASIEQTQTQLVQQRKDAEQRQPYQTNDGTKAEDDVQFPWYNETTDMSWASIKTTQLGEFK